MKVKLPIIGQVRTGKDAEVGKVISVDKGFDSLGGILEFSDRNLSGATTVSTKVLQANRGWVYRNNDVIAQEVSKIEFELYTIGLSAGEIVFNPIEDHPLLDLLDQPNDETSKTDAMYVIQSHKKLSGDAFWLKLRKNGQVVGLRTLPPDKITLILQTPSEKDPTIIKAYHYEEVIEGKTLKADYKPEDIIHFKKPNPNNPFRGLGAVEALAETIDLDNLTTEMTKRFFQNGAISNFVLTTEGKITEEQLKRLKAEMRSEYGGASNAYKTMILGGGLKPEDISYSNKDQEFLGQLEWYRDKIMYGFGNTKSSMGILEDVNRSTNQSALVEWQRNTIKPDMQAIVDTLNIHLVPEFGEGLVLGFCDPVPEDRADDILEIKDLYPIGILTKNEAREMIDLEEVDGGDEFYTAPAPVVADPNDSKNDKKQEDQ